MNVPQGTFVGTLFSLIFTMWIGFGSTVAKNFGHGIPPKKINSIEGCPAHFINETLTAAAATSAATDK